MKIDIVLNVEQINKERITDKVTVAIDTFRATTTIVTALSNGAKEVIPVKSVEEALNYNTQDEDIVVAGERSGEKMPELDLGNSPLSYTEKIIKGKKLVLTTTNGTKMLLNLKDSKQIIIASIINLKAVAQEINEIKEVIICCAGTQGEFSLEDFITAGALIYKLRDLSVDLELTDLSLVAYQTYFINKDNLFRVLSNSKNGSRLISLGKKADVDYSIKEDILSKVPICVNDKIISQD
ncbi:2-phosphosulfolactate phosphatase [Selenihalanaerobacter shriftii]|uniref:Probable 2-phosphosulfolactate phosphatase n=1 Tax=Selenihalanaerobacter shriftii TaxID=142842 RepID=A0A1T4PA79_9FIRM|nr:2-phosphosulfolactate phosphatase [Selenihalanaerobacter shriftii]SJZ88237.1 2-phosphosulfolactate phosphatase [Selenihalanaerobacter shriftii]